MSGAFVTAVRWNYLLQFAGLILRIGFAAILARLLAPEDYGLVAAAVALLRFLEYIRDLGLSSALVQSPELDTKIDAPVAFLFLVSAQTILVVGLLSAMPLLSAGPFQSIGANGSILLALAAFGIASAGGQVARAILVRRMEFRRIAGIHLLCLGVGQGFVTIPLAVLDFGAWAIVWGSGAQSVLTALLCWMAAPHPLLPAAWPWQRIRHLVVLSGRFSVLRIMDSAGLHMLPLWVGGLVGVVGLGYWDRAWILAVVPVEMLVAGAAGVLFPALSRMQSDLDRLLQSWLSMLTLFVATLSAVAIGMSIAATNLVAVILGPDWLGVSGPLSVLVLWMTVRSVTLANGLVCEAVGQLNLRALHQCGYLIALCLCLVVFRPDTAMAVATILLAVDTVAQIVLLALMRRVVPHPPLIAFRRIGVALSLSVPVACAALLASYGQLILGPAGTLVLQIVACALALLLGIVLHPSRTLRLEYDRRVLAEFLGVPLESGSFLSSLRSWLRR